MVKSLWQGKSRVGVGGGGFSWLGRWGCLPILQSPGSCEGAEHLVQERGGLLQLPESLRDYLRGGLSLSLKARSEEGGLTARLVAQKLVPGALRSEGPFLKVMG